MITKSPVPQPPLKSAGARPPLREAGFIITVEFLLITTILIIGTLVGLVAVRDSLFKHYANREALAITVYDAQGIPMGKAMGLDEHEAPLVPYVDRSVPPLAPDPGHRNYRAMIGIRDDRFSSREPIYYSGADCTGTPCIKSTSDESTDSTGVSGIGATGAVSYIHALQNGPNYAIGRSPDGIQGYLYRSTASSCPVPVEELQSRYASQRVVAGSPCEAYEPPTASNANTDCLLDAPLVDCNCPIGFADQGDILTRNAAEIDAQISLIAGTAGAAIPLEVGTVCCPTGTELQDDGDLAANVAYVFLTNVVNSGALPATAQTLIESALEPYTGELICRTDFVVKEAIEVNNPADPSQNALAGFNSPFQVNLPIDMEDDSWISTAPDGEGR